MGKKPASGKPLGKKKVAALILDQLQRLEDRLDILTERLETLDERIEALATEKSRRDHRDARMKEHRTQRERRFDMYED
ncbi:MAG: hypothetical protein AB1592_11670 [Pseudomonadota bacterium]